MKEQQKSQISPQPLAQQGLLPPLSQFSEELSSERINTGKPTQKKAPRAGCGARREQPLCRWGDDGGEGARSNQHLH